MKPPLILSDRSHDIPTRKRIIHVLLLICNNQLTEWKTDKSQDIKALGV